LSQSSSPVVCRTARFHVNARLGMLNDGRQYSLFAHGLVGDFFAKLIENGNLKYVFGKIYDNGGRIFHGMGS